MIITVAIATTIGAIIKGRLRKKYQSKTKIAKPANGAAIPICTNIS